MDDPGRGRPVPTLEEVWEEHGARLERLAGRLLGGDPAAVRAACYRVMVAVGEELTRRPTAPSGAGLWEWAERRARDVCAEIARFGFDPAAVPEGPFPGVLPAPLRLRLQLRAMKEAGDLALEERGAASPIEETVLRERRRLRDIYERWRRGLPGLLVLPRRAWRAPGGAPRLSGLLAASPLLSEAATVAVAAVVLGVAAPAAATGDLTGAVSLAVTARAAPGAVASQHAGDHAPTAASRDGRPSSPSASVPLAAAPVPSPDPDPHPAGEGTVTVGVAAPGPASPEVAASPPSPDRPVREEPVGDESLFMSPEARVNADVNGDGEDEASVGTPVVGIGCPTTENREPVTGVACPVADEATPEADD